MKAAWGRLRFVFSWAAALALVGIALPKVFDGSWEAVLPVLKSVPKHSLITLSILWLVGLIVHTFVLTAAAPSLSHRRALTLNVTGSAISNVVPMGGAAGIELNRRMMKAWGIDTRTFTGYTFLTNLWDVGSKLLLPIIAVLALARAGNTIAPELLTISLAAGAAFVGLVAFTAVLLGSPHLAQRLGDGLERMLRAGLRLIGKDRPIGVAAAIDGIRRECLGRVTTGWVRMSVGIIGYVALQGLLLDACLRLTGSLLPWPAVLAAFAVERLLTIIPITPGGAGFADLGLVGVLLTLGGDPVSVTAAALLYRLFIFAIEIPVGGGVLGLWLLAQRRKASYDVPARPAGVRRVAHVTDVFLPRLGGIETHVDDLVRHQRAAGIDAEVLTPTVGTDADPAWVRRLPVSRARHAITGYDTVHVHLSMWSPYGVSVARAAMSAGIPTLITVHSMWAGAGGVLRLAALTSVGRWPVAWSAVSSAAAEAFRQSLGRTRVSVLPNAIDVASWRGPRPLADGPVTLISTMRLMPRKRPMVLLRMLIEARRMAPDLDLRLVIVGDGPLRARVQRFVRRHELTGIVTITGRIPREQVLARLRAASIYVAPAPKESFGIAALEARSAGLPVIARSQSGVNEFIHDRIDGLLVADDTEMAVAIADLASDVELRQRITDHNVRVAPQHDWTTALRRTEELYREAASLVELPEHSPERVLVSA